LPRKRELGIRQAIFFGGSHALRTAWNVFSVRALALDLAGLFDIAPRSVFLLLCRHSGTSGLVDARVPGQSIRRACPCKGPQVRVRGARSSARSSPDDPCLAVLGKAYVVGVEAAAFDDRRDGPLDERAPREHREGGDAQRLEDNPSVKPQASCRPVERSTTQRITPARAPSPPRSNCATFLTDT
jgi:hypothetical protein